MNKDILCESDIVPFFQSLMWVKRESKYQVDLLLCSLSLQLSVFVAYTQDMKAGINLFREEIWHLLSLKGKMSRCIQWLVHTWLWFFLKGGAHCFLSFIKGQFNVFVAYILLWLCNFNLFWEEIWHLLSLKRKESRCFIGLFIHDHDFYQRKGGGHNTLEIL